MHVRGLGRDAVVDEISDGRGQGVPKVSQRLDEVGRVWRNRLRDLVLLPQLPLPSLE